MAPPNPPRREPPPPERIELSTMPPRTAPIMPFDPPLRKPPYPPTSKAPTSRCAAWIACAASCSARCACGMACAGSETWTCCAVARLARASASLVRACAPTAPRRAAMKSSAAEI
ncbi:MAG TPA: hypothetical protein DGU37_06565 [Microbacterium sp.]|nr:hypothetical protein [Microbacterium sp.]